MPRINCKPCVPSKKIKTLEDMHTPSPSPVSPSYVPKALASSPAVSRDRSTESHTAKNIGTPCKIQWGLSLVGKRLCEVKHSITTDELTHIADHQSRHKHHLPTLKPLGRLPVDIHILTSYMAIETNNRRSGPSTSAQYTPRSGGDQVPEVKVLSL